ncbi:MAG: outer membrane protein assembly factor BamE [Verrucomicrobiota bacterium]|nr:outer membrane protein assembly factor BamE [Verrucomicrobiota bacterium]
MKTTVLRSFFVLFAAFALFCIGACDKLGGSKLTRANYDQVVEGMSKAQVETVLGKPTTVERKDMIIFAKTTYRYEEGKKFALITFKNDEVNEKDTNLDRK